jgi:uncharacterized LabA/DUF88 family protein
MSAESVKTVQFVAILIDGNNMGLSLQDILKNKEKMVDYDKVIPQVMMGRLLKRFYFFREGVTISDKFSKRLQSKYFGNVIPCDKSADLELAMTAIELADKVDTIIIFSGDKDFIPLVKRLRSRGVRVEIAGYVLSTAKKLIDEADYYHEISPQDSFVFK